MGERTVKRRELYGVSRPDRGYASVVFVLRFLCLFAAIRFFFAIFVFFRGYPVFALV
jgi:hypothetical protein